MMYYQLVYIIYVVYFLYYQFCINWVCVCYLVRVENVFLLVLVWIDYEVCR